MMPFSDQKKFIDITPEDISDIYRIAKEDPSFIYDMMKGYSSGIVNGEEYSEPVDNVKTIALHTNFSVRAIEEICIEHEIDAVIFNQYVKWEKFIDYLSFKRVRLTHTDRSIRCILQFHSSFQRMFKLEGSIGSDWLTESEDISKLPLSSGDSKDIIYLARFSTTKNQMDMIKAMKKVVAKVPEARLILTGDNNWYTDKCKKYVHTLQ